MADNKITIKQSITIKPSIVKTTFVKKSDYKITKVHPAPIEIVKQVSLYERWNNDCLNHKASPIVCVQHKQVSINERWLDDCVG